MAGVASLIRQAFFLRLHDLVAFPALHIILFFHFMMAILTLKAVMNGVVEHDRRKLGCFSCEFNFYQFAWTVDSQ